MNCASCSRASIAKPARFYFARVTKAMRNVYNRAGKNPYLRGELRRGMR